jgi:GDP-L-fucose synthase
MKKIFVAGHKGMVGSAIVRQLEKQVNEGAELEIIVRDRTQLNLLSQSDVQAFFASANIDEVYLAAAKVGGIVANNTYPADFIYENLMIQNNIIHSAHLADVDDILFLGSSCIYPKLAAQPMSESSLLTGTLEPTNEPYAIAKIAGIKFCESYNRQYGRNYRSVMPTNLYGENDNFHPENSHVIPALMRRFHEAKLNNTPEVIVWGSGNPMREFLHVDDMAAASIFVMNASKDVYESCTQEMLSHINVGTGVDCTIAELALTMAKVVGYQGQVGFDATKPDGAPRKLMNVDTLKALGWSYSIDLKEGLAFTYAWFLSNQHSFRG